MSEFSEILISVEQKIVKLVEKKQELQSKNDLLTNELKKSEELIKKQVLEIQNLKSEIESLKIVSSLLGSEENKRDTKLKINSLIREIDYCIAQLSDWWTMGEKLKIKISIADRVYPLTVDTSQEEGLRSASKKIDTMIKQFEENYAVRDKQDVLAMCALQFAAQVEQKQIDTVAIDKNSLDKLQQINELLSKSLEK